MGNKVALDLNGRLRLAEGSGDADHSAEVQSDFWDVSAGLAFSL